MKNKGLLAILLLISMACSKDGPEPDIASNPVPVKLEFPLKNSECTSGIDQGSAKTRIEFRWGAADNDSYEVVVENLLTNQINNANTTTNMVEMLLDKNTPYQWHVISKVSGSEKVTESESWKFYSAGEGISNYAPFPAELISPKEGAQFEIEEQQMTLVWESKDIDDTSLVYDVYVGTQNPPQELVATDITETNFDISLDIGSKVYWSVKSRDDSGNSSRSKVGSFEVGGVSGISSFDVRHNEETYQATIEEGNKIIRIRLGNFEYKKLIPQIGLKNGYSISPKNGDSLNFNDDLFFVVTDPTGKETRYELVVESGQMDVQTFKVHSGTEIYFGIVDNEAATIHMEMGNFDYADSNTEIELDPKATLDLDEVSHMNLQSSATFTVTSEIGTTKQFTVIAPIRMSRLYSYLWNPGFDFSNSNSETNFRAFAGSTQYISTRNVQDPSQVNIQLVNDSGDKFPMPILRNSYSHQHSFEYSSSENQLTTEIPSDLPAGSYSVLISEGLRNAAYPQRFEVINDDRVIRITGINQTDFVRGDTLILTGVNLRKELAIKSNGSIYIFNQYASDLTVNAEGTELRLFFSTNVYGNLKSWSGDNEKPLAIQTIIEDYPNKLSSNIVYFNVN